nr:hypothetical protein [Prolixibacteraceae bacterium]
MTTNKLNDTILKNLYSDNEVSIEKALENIAQNGNSAYIPSLVDILNTSESIAIKNRISKILAEVKHTDSVPLLI